MSEPTNDFKLPDHLQRFVDENPAFLAKNSRFAPKMSFRERCACLVAVKIMGINKRQVALAFGVNPSTINFIIQPASPHYKNVREERFQLGDERFAREYMDEEMLRKITAVKDHPDLGMTERALEAKLSEERSKVLGPDPRANRMAGVHAFANHGMGRLFVEVKFFAEPPEPLRPDDPPRHAGWYLVALPTSDAYVKWQMEGAVWGLEKNSATSKSALDGIQEAFYTYKDDYLLRV